ncbi:hypothetical protein N7495_007562 [Penicillium taxi]|uniref:uncharacterized protein n=1 Tax=Penicillium taxi TaxID=168475 RepID=UPI002545A792|nr:uncharacterized protein N7495_007562 [Penicillium taxi]KAJ5887521.1 hypothetical protein N7495_007562 [Penicillium taxi]
MEKIIPSSTVLDSPDSFPAATPREKHSSPKKVQNATQKPKQTKSRNGCITCKAKRLKCDETKPSCHQCERRKVTCGGYKRDFKWRPFEETNLSAGRPPTAKPKKIKNTHDSPISTTISESISIPSTSGQTTSPTRAYARISGVTPPESSLYSHSSPASIKSYLSGDTHSLDDFPIISELSTSSEDPVSRIAVSHSLDFDSMNFLSYPEPSQQSTSLLHGVISDSELDCGSVRIPMPLVSNSYRPPPSEMNFSQLLDNESESIEEITRRYNSNQNSLSSSNLNSGPWGFSSPHNNAFDLSRLPGQPSLAPESQEMLALRFDKLTCGILSIKDGLTENPWRNLIWPLAKDTPALQHALRALSAFHSMKENPSLRVQGVKHMRQSITLLRRNWQTMRPVTALATSIALAFADTWNQNTRTCIQHLRGAKSLMFQVVNVGLQGGMGEEDLDCIRFLYNTWTYMDVMARLTSLDDSDTPDINPAIFQLPDDAVHEIDPLMGSATTLFPLIGRVARLVQRARKTTSNSVSTVSQAMELKSLVEQWEPPHWFEPPEDPTSEVQHSIQVAYAYRWATLLYLHQAVPEMPSESAVELAKRVLILLATVPSTSRTTIIQRFPLLAAGCEVDMEDDRKWVMERWSTVQSRLMLGGIDRCLDVVREVWSRRDALKAQQEQDLAGNRRSSPFSGENKNKSSSTFHPPNSGNSRGFSSRPNHNEQEISSRGRSRSIAANSVSIRRGSALSPLENIQFERTVRSRLHWVNVMGEWKWEALRKLSLSPQTLLD